jgi:hypothetical protein
VPALGTLGYSVTPPSDAGRIRPERLAVFNRNQWPDSPGLSGRIRPDYTLHAHPDAWRMECTAFGINMVSGNYEFACLVAIHEEAWWASYGHLLEANWETMRLQRYSSLDHDGLLRLMVDDRWSNEGLFALIEGLRRLAVLDPARVHAPDIGWA